MPDCPRPLRALTANLPGKPDPPPPRVYITLSLLLLFNPGTVATFNCMWAFITQDPFILTFVSDCV